jgi:hypothetical protein
MIIDEKIRCKKRSYILFVQTQTEQKSTSTKEVKYSNGTSLITNHKVTGSGAVQFKDGNVRELMNKWRLSRSAT